MKNNNVIELQTYRHRSAEERLDPAPEAARDDSTQPAVSKELQLAIKRLIQRMRKHGPIRKVKRIQITPPTGTNR